MLIRRLVIASLIAGAASAQAGNITTSAVQPSNVVSGWTTGNGTDVLGSGVLQGSNLNLVAGVAHTADASLSDILYGKVAGSVEQVDGQTKLFFQRGIEANYLLASGHGILAATSGLGKSVVGDAYGAIISDGVAKLPGMTGGGNQNSTTGNSGNSSTGKGSNSSGSNSSGSNSSGSNSSGSNSSGSNSSGSNSSGGNSSGSNSSGSNSSGNNGNGNLDQGNGSGIGNGGLNGNGDGIGTGKGDGLGNIGNQVGEAAEVAEVPEPSSIALMLLGMMGAGAISRRRSR